MAHRRPKPLVKTAAAVLTMGVLSSACAAGGGGSEGTDEGQTLTIWHHFVAGGQLEALKAQNELFNDAHPDVKIKMVQLPFEQSAPKMLATASTEDGPDIVFTNVVVDFPSLASAGVLYDQTDYWNSFDDKDFFPEAATWEDGAGDIYNVMSYTNLLGLYFNNDILAEYNIEPPETVSELEDAMATIAADGKYTPLSMSAYPDPQGAWMFFPLLLGQDVGYCDFETDKVTASFETMASWTDRGFLPKAAATWDQADAWQQFMSGKFAFGINGNWNLGDAGDASFDLGTTQYPAGPAGSQVFPGGEGIGIGAYTDNPDLAWTYIEEAWLSREASLINFEKSGQIPTRDDLGDDPAIADNELVTPFVKAAADTAEWPKNSQTAQMQTAVGEAVSAVVSGQKTPRDGAHSAVDAVTKALEKGGGEC